MNSELTTSAVTYAVPLSLTYEPLTV